ncbi:MAG: sulfatase-like hydrolase/transferase [Melioribacteraceae bacterium]|nr:sulfatase-like hydrolase/transferase [Melioribacteraceae bacterium]MCF8264189.1 sulfatase-like hydrolase/transferase [Melioribacteraceae bacterium]MCF8413089.1 sulfatase-like hydrolase/transferase [Melioribacteraceae bacterium]
MASSKKINESNNENKTNILFILSDQQRWDTVECYGEPIFKNLTPNLDQMAAEGVRFHNTFTAQPVCGPTRSCLQTGKYATETGCFRNEIGLKPDEKTLAHWLSECGYKNAYIGKWHLATNKIKGRPVEDYWDAPVPPEKRGGYNDFWLASDVLEFTSHSYDGYMFDQNGNKKFLTKGKYRADVLTDWAIEYIKEQKDEVNPFFLFLSYIEPHHQNDNFRYEGPKGSKEKFAEYRVPDDLKRYEGDWEKEMPDYLGCCNALDYNLGRIRKELARLNMDEDTLVIYVSDHGSHFRTRNDEYKRSCHESSIRVPLIIYGPGFKGGKVVNEMVSLIDLPPTVVKAAGRNVPQSMKGKPLQLLLDNDKYDWQKDVFVQISESQVGRAIRTKRWKYSVTAPHKEGWDDFESDTFVEDCLYDLENDPSEINNLVEDPTYDEIRTELAERLIQRMMHAGEERPIIHSARWKNINKQFGMR